MTEKSSKNLKCYRIATLCLATNSKGAYMEQHGLRVNVLNLSAINEVRQLSRMSLKHIHIYIDIYRHIHTIFYISVTDTFYCNNLNVITHIIIV